MDMKHPSLIPPGLHFPRFSPTPERKVPLLSLGFIDCCGADSDDDLSKLLPNWFLQGSAVLNFEPTKDNVTRVTTEIHQKAGFLRGLQSLELWRWTKKEVAEGHTRIFTVF